MDIIAIGKPQMNVYLSLVEFPKEGDTFNLDQAYENLGGVAATAACLLSKWRLPCHFTGVVGNDNYGDKIKEVFSQYKIDIKYIETDYTHKTSTNYIIVDNKKGTNAKILCRDNAVQLQRYKYDFQPTAAILDGTDESGSLALLNNSNCTTFFYGRRGTDSTISLAKKCKYVICTQKFAEDMIKESCDGSAESCVNFFQKIVDSAGSSNYVIIMDNYKILYSSSNQIKMVPAVKLNALDTSSFEAIFTGAFAYAILNENTTDVAIKFANMAASLSNGKIGSESSIPELSNVVDNSGLRDTVKVVAPAINLSSAPTQTADVTPQVETNQTNEVAPTVETNAVEEVPTQTTNEVPSAPVLDALDELPTPVTPTPAPVENPSFEESNMFDV